MGSMSLLPSAILPNCHIRAMEGIIQSLGKRGIPIVALSHKKDCPAFHSRYVSQVIQTPPSEDGSSYIDFLTSRVPKGVLFTANDQTTLLFGHHRREITESGFRMNLPDQQALQEGFDKWRCFLHATGINVPCAHTMLIEGADSLYRIAAEMPYPFIIKATTLAGGNYIRVTTPDAVLPAYQKMLALIRQPENASMEPRLIAQEWLDYDMENIWCVESYFDQSGASKGFFTIQKLRTVVFPEGTFGSRLYAGKSVKNDELAGMADRLLRSLSWRGFTHLDCVYSPGRQSYFLTEINPRLPGFSFFPSQAGFEMGYFYYADLAGMAYDACNPKEAFYFEFFRYPGDLSSGLSLIMQRKYPATKFVLSYLMPLLKRKKTVFEYFSIHDPKMTLHGLLSIAREFRKRF